MKMEDKEKLSEIKKKLAEVENAIKKSSQKAEVFDLEVDKQVLLDEIQELEEKIQADGQQEDQNVKCWDKIDENHWIHKNKGIEMAVYSEEDFWIAGAKQIKDEKVLFMKTPDTKSEALRLAYEYMKQHEE